MTAKKVMHVSPQPQQTLLQQQQQHPQQHQPVVAAPSNFTFLDIATTSIVNNYTRHFPQNTIIPATATTTTAAIHNRQRQKALNLQKVRPRPNQRQHQHRGQPTKIHHYSRAKGRLLHHQTCR